MTTVPSNDNSNFTVIFFNFSEIFPKKSRFRNDSLICYCHSISQLGDQVKRQQDILKRKSRYQSYVVCCWQERSVHAGREITVWRFSLQNPRTNQRRGFATIESLLVSLQAELTDDEVD